MKHFYPMVFMDAPQVLDTSITPIPGGGSPPMQVVADIGTRATRAIDFIDNTGAFIGVYVGAAGKEVLKCIIGGGVNTRAYAVINVHNRVSFRSMTAASITNGQLTCAFVGD